MSFTAQEVANAVYELINESSVSSFIDNDFTLELINQALREFALRTDVYTDIKQQSVSANTQTLTLPDDFFAIAGKDNTTPCIYRLDSSSNRIPIPYVVFSDFVNYNLTATAQYPSVFSLKYSFTSDVPTLYFQPIPTSSFIVVIPYIVTPPRITSFADTIYLDRSMLIPFAFYVAWCYKYRDREPNFGDYFYLHFNNAVTQYQGIARYRRRSAAINWVMSQQQRQGRRTR